MFAPLAVSTPVREFLTLMAYHRPMPPRSARRSSREPDRRVAQALDAAISSLVSASGGEDDEVSRHLQVAAAALALAGAADRLAREEILVARDVDGATWEQVGEALGISRQGAFERFRTGPDGMHSRLFMKTVSYTHLTLPTN